MSKETIIVRGARTNNLKNISVDIPRDKLVVFTGLSGSGKSTLAFETIYAEGHRRFVESLSSYARQFLGQMDKPDVDLIEGLSPAISIEQKTTSKNPRSTVGTVTEIYDYLRLLYARVGTPHCPVCGKEITQQSLDQILDRIMRLPEGTRFMVLAPVVRAQKGMHEKVLTDAKKAGYVRVRVDGSLYDLSEEITLDKNLKHSIDIIIDRLVLKPEIRSRLGESVENALRLTDGRVTVALVPREGEEERELEFSQKYACEEHQISFGELEPAMFSFNNPLCACPRCAGLGEMPVISEKKLIPHPELSLRQGALAANGFKTMDEHSYTGPLVVEVGKAYGFTLDTPLSDYTPAQRKVLLWGTGDREYECLRWFGKTPKNAVTTFEGIIPTIERRMTQAGMYGDYYQQFIEDAPCPDCHGARLNDTMLAVTVGGKNIDEVCRMSVGHLIPFFENLHFDDSREKIAHDIVTEIKKRLRFLSSVGLDYLTLARKAGTLSGGEAQRIRLATQIGSALVGVLYILDEPSIGLHQRDNGKLIKTLCSLRDLGNTVIVVEHDEETMEAADYIVDIGPGAGIHGGEVVVAGTPQEVAACQTSLTGDYLSGRRKIPVPTTRRTGNGKFLTVRGARENNLKCLTVKFPLGCFICVTGVSGSGKSTLVNTCLERTLARELNGAVTYPGLCDGVDGLDALDKVIHIDQSPIGRTPRSNPATYTGVFNDIRDLFAKTPDAKAKAYGPGRFSFNIRGGRCEACQGDGVKCIEMHFLPDVYVKCDVCNGMRYNHDTLDVRYKGKNIYEVLEMTIEESLAFFDSVPQIRRKIQTLCDVGLGYLKLGQSSTTLSGGEAQRVKLATELARRSTGKTVYILDEPTTGLHTADVAHLIEILNRLVDSGNTVIVIEHNLDLIKTADYLIDLGPEGGDGGGTLVACGTPEEVAENPASFTGVYLKKKLN
ncbi:MAG: excinuclease ABC subunit UvrA [Clostridia bacterium]|nr:excinuclease ABC subunit UvrA [Clostridia bacterium]MDY6185151.1 excinuclease ABC subunit UvrA [Eubacteriales bacterium]